MAEDDRDKPWERYLRRPPKPAPKRKRSPDKKALPLGGTDSVWERHRPQPKKCAICGKPFTPGKDRPPNAMTCASRECMAEYERRYARGYYTDNSAKIIDQTSASRRRRHKPIVKHCIAPHPTISGALCGKEFEVKTTGDGRRLTCSPGCSRRRRWALQRDRYHADPQAKRDYKNAHYSANYAKPVGTTRCPNPACGREYLKRRSNQHTCGRAVCHLWQQGIKHRDKINARKRKKRRANPGADAAYQRKYREANPAKFKGYHAKRRANPEYAAYQRKYREANREELNARERERFERIRLKDNRVCLERPQKG
jgi:hypothetical protein